MNRQNKQATEGETSAPILIATPSSTADILDEMKQERGSVEVYPTGFPEFDKALGGGFSQGLHVISGESGTGKTALVLQMATHMATKGIPVLYFSLEVARGMIISRQLSALNAYYPEAPTAVNIEVNGNYIAQPVKLSPIEYLRRKRYDETTGKLVPLDEVIQTTVDVREEILKSILLDRFGVIDAGAKDKEGNSIPLTITNVSRIIEQGQQRTRIRPVIVLDYLQYLPPARDGLSDKQATDSALRELKRLADIYGLCMLVISSVNRTSYGTTPTEGSVKESGLIEFTADTLISLTVADVYRITDKQERTDAINHIKSQPVRPMEVHIIKNRTGLSGWRLSADFVADCGYFDNVRYLGAYSSEAGNSIINKAPNSVADIIVR